MAKSLVIVESPAKVRTIKRYVGKEFDVRASMGHVKDLPKSTLGVDVEDGYRPQYTVIKGKGKILKDLRQVARQSERVYLALDPDREGEAIAWHIAQEIDGTQSDKVFRILFNEITERAILEAVRNAGRIDLKKVEAQQARRILDRLVGYKISPLLWKKVKRGLSAGRVQSVTLRLICDREKEIQAFRSEEYWTIAARLLAAEPPPFEARLLRRGEEKIAVPDEATAQRICEELRASTFVVERVERKERKRNPEPPFITSTLQREASTRLRYSAQRTMSIAQRLYEGLEIGAEGVVGLITYMRTDSPHVAQEAQAAARKVIASLHGKDYLPASAPRYRGRKTAQEAHEAVRPTDPARHPEAVRAFLSKEEYELYRLIWNRFLASQMAPAVYDTTSADVRAGAYLLRATGSVVKFLGFTVLYASEPEGAGESQGEEQGQLPHLSQGQSLALQELTPKQRFTQPRPRYSEAMLLKELEENGVGRPSTYATILSILQDREYAVIEERRFRPTELGMIVSDLLINHFPTLMSVEFTAKLEDELDKVEEGKQTWVAALDNFYRPFHQHLERAQEEMEPLWERIEQTDMGCPRCGDRLVVRWGSNGFFLACTRYPACTFTSEFQRQEDGTIKIVEQVASDETCDRCGRPMVVKQGRYGRFLACSGYPDCRSTRPISTGVPCPREGCTGKIVEKRTRRGRIFYGCNRYPECEFATWSKPVDKKCPQCGSPYLVEKTGKTGRGMVQCPQRGCDHREEVVEDEASVPATQESG